MRHTQLLGSWLSTLLLSSATYASLQIVPGATWTASNGEHLNAHGAGVIRVNDTFYLIGEDKSDGSAFQNINCYSSTDLVQWTFEGALLSRTSSGDLGPDRIVERPKVIYNDDTQKYVMWMHIDSSDYSDARVGVAVGDSVCGTYNYLRSFRPLDFESRDIGLFKDDDGTAYLLTEDRKNGLRINKLTDDYLDVAEATYLWEESIESPAMIKYESRYYMFGSHLTGWEPNDNVYSHSTSLTSGWSSWTTFADPGGNTYASQTTFILAYPPDNNLMYMGDRWVSSNLQSSTYIWLPLTITPPTVTMKYLPSGWPPLSPSTTPSLTTYPASSFTLTPPATTVPCPKCPDGSQAVGYIGGPNNGIVTIGNIRSDAENGTATTVVVRYVNGDKAARYARVSVNGQAVGEDGDGKVAFVGTGGEVKGSVVVVEGGLRKGEGNEIVFGGFEGGWGPDIESVIVQVA